MTELLAEKPLLFHAVAAIVLAAGGWMLDHNGQAMSLTKDMFTTDATGLRLKVTMQRLIDAHAKARQGS